MDPNAALEEIREIAHRCLDVRPWDTVADAMHDATAMAEAFEALDVWISAAGFLPDAWKGAK